MEHDAGAGEQRYKHDLTLWAVATDAPEQLDRIRWNPGDREPRYDTGRARDLVRGWMHYDHDDIDATLTTLTGWSNAYVSIHPTERSPQ